jgi:hypothetical protein
VPSGLSDVYEPSIGPFEPSAEVVGASIASGIESPTSPVIVMSPERQNRGTVRQNSSMAKSIKTHGQGLGLGSTCMARFHALRIAHVQSAKPPAGASPAAALGARREYNAGPVRLVGEHRIRLSAKIGNVC